MISVEPSHEQPQMFSLITTSTSSLPAFGSLTSEQQFAYVTNEEGLRQMVQQQHFLQSQHQQQIQLNLSLDESQLSVENRVQIQTSPSQVPNQVIEEPAVPSVQVNHSHSSPSQDVSFSSHTIRMHENQKPTSVLSQLLSQSNVKVLGFNSKLPSDIPYSPCKETYIDQKFPVFDYSNTASTSVSDIYPMPFSSFNPSKPPCFTPI